jgi:hypothetical protein
LSALRTGKYSWYSFLLEAESTPGGHSAAGRIMSMKNFSDTIGNGTRDLPTCSAVPQPTAPPGAPQRAMISFFLFFFDPLHNGQYFFSRHFYKRNRISTSSVNNVYGKNYKRWRVKYSLKSLLKVTKSRRTIHGIITK